jgi:Leucine-rich repeat (LRR) protein
MRSKQILLFLLCILPAASVFSQKGKKEPLKHEQEVRDMIAFFQYMVNTLGDAATSTRDKDVMIMESYSKIFRDGKVQVEDDLDPDRKVITNKDITAYLKDVDFFFKNVKFEFNIDKIESSGISGDKLYYKVSLSRNLNGITADGQKMQNTIPRYIEVNYDTKTEDLKIVSIYTHQFNEKKALMEWWRSLSYEWRSIFTNQFHLEDSAGLSDIRRILSTDSLDISGNQYVRSLDPVSQFNDLQYLNISGSHINDLTPLRNLTGLTDVDISKTTIKDLSPLRYAVNLRRLNINNTKVDSIHLVERFPTLTVLEMSNTAVKDFSPLANLDSLKVLDVSHSPIHSLQHVSEFKKLYSLNIANTGTSDIGPLKQLPKLSVLYLDSTAVKELKPLAGLSNLRVVHFNYTPVSSLAPLKSLPNLERIYCDHSAVTQREAADFNSSNPKVLIIYDSEDLRGWWTDLQPVWKDVLSRRVKISYNPSKEDLAKVANIDSLNISNYVNIKTLSPLAKLQKLQVLIASKSGISDITALRTSPLLRSLDISHTSVAELGPIAVLTNLQTLYADGSQIKSIDTLKHVRSLERIYADRTALNDSLVSAYIKSSPRCLVVYKTDRLEKWWSNLSPEWQTALQRALNVETQPTRQNFHRLIEVERLTIENQRLNDLSPLAEFIRLTELRLNGCAVTSLKPVGELKTLRRLYMRDNPLRDLSPLTNLQTLEDLDISNTAVAELDVISRLKHLRTLSCAGTPIRKLNPLLAVNALEHLDCSNTEVKNLEPIFHLPLKTLKCYNSKVSKSDVDKFKKYNPDCEVIYYR